MTSHGSWVAQMLKSNSSISPTTNRKCQMVLTGDYIFHTCSHEEMNALLWKLQKKQEFEVTTSCKQLWLKLAGEVLLERRFYPNCMTILKWKPWIESKKAQKTACSEQTGSGKNCDEHCSTEQQQTEMHSSTIAWFKCDKQKVCLVIFQVSEHFVALDLTHACICT